MKIYQITDEKFKKYGRVIRDADAAGILEAMQNTPCPREVEYVPSLKALEEAKGGKRDGSKSFRRHAGADRIL